MANRHIVLLTYPAQGHLNPALQFAARVTHIGAHVTLLVNTYLRRKMIDIPNSKCLTLVEFSDGYIDDNNTKDDKEERQKRKSNFKESGSRALTEFILESACNNRPIDCVVYTTILATWAGEVARGLHVPSTLLWIQPATVFGLWYYYFNGFEDIIKTKSIEDPSFSIKLPNMTLPFATRDLPWFLVPNNMHEVVIQMFKEELDLVVSQKNNLRVLVNTFDDLEHEALSAIDGIQMIGIGPLNIQSNLVDIYQPSSQDEYITWLDSKPKSSVVYVSFGSLFVLPERQAEEIEAAMSKSDFFFLWVIRATTKNNPDDAEENENNDGHIVMKRKNMIVTWCNQVEVLSHPSVGCFVTHCGWNSTMESLVCGVPIVAFPQWVDQCTNAMMVEEIWKTGVRVTTHGLEGLVDGDEINRCLEIVMGDGEKGEEIRKNAKKWKELASDAIKEGGSSDINLRTFLDEIALV